MVCAVSRLLGLAVLRLLLAGAVTAPLSERAQAFSSPQVLFESHALGTCTVALSLDPGMELAEVRLSPAEGSPGFFPGGSYHTSGGMGFGEPVAGALAEHCGLENVSDVSEDGADSSFAEDGYIGFSFKGVEGGVTYDYEYAIAGRSDTVLVARHQVANLPPVITLDSAYRVQQGASLSITPQIADPDRNDTLTSVRWSLVSPEGLSLELTGADTETVSFVAPPAPPGGLRLTLRLDLAFGDWTTSRMVPVLVVRDAGAPNAVPVISEVSAPPAQYGQTVDLLVVATDDDGDDLSYEWVQTDGSGVVATLINPTSPTPSFWTAPAPVGTLPAELKFSVTVSDGFETTEGFASIILTAPDRPAPEIILARESMEAVSGDRVDLEAIVNAGDGGPVTVVWTQVSGATVALSTSGTNASFVAPPLAIGAAAEVLVFRVTATDLESVSKDVTVTVTPPAVPPNRPPVVDAGSDVQVVSGQQLVLGGASVSDPDGMEGVSFEWSWDSPLLTTEDRASLSPTLAASGLVVGSGPVEVVVTLTAFDGVVRGTDSLTVTILPPENQPPTVELAGPAGVASGGAIELVATAYDPDGQRLFYAWTLDGQPMEGDGPVLAVDAPVLAVGAGDQILTFAVTASDGEKTATAVIRVAIRAPPNTAPTVSLQGSGTVPAGGTIRLSAVAADAEGQELSYVWYRGEERLADAGSVFSATAPTLYAEDADRLLTFRVEVSDGITVSAAATTVTVGAPEPVVRASASAGDLVGGETGRLLAEVSGFSGGMRLDYSWTTDAVGVVIEGHDRAEASFTVPDAMPPQMAEFTVTVSWHTSDAVVRTASSSVSVRMGPDGAPTVVVDAPAVVAPGAEVVMDASGSVDPENSKLLVRWGQVGGPVVALLPLRQVASGAGGESEDVAGPAVGFTAPDLPEGVEEEALRFSVTVSDGVNASSETVVIILRRAVAPVQVARSMVLDLSLARTGAAIDAQPDLGAVLGREGGAADVTVSSMGGTVDIATAFDRPIWLRVKGSWATIAGAETGYVLGALGMHATWGETLALGVTAQADHIRSEDGMTVARGSGWLLGPYVVARLPDQAVTFQGRVLFGRTRNSLSPLGTYTDRFGGERLLAQVGLSGEVVRGAVTWGPRLKASYGREVTEAYVDGGGTAIPSVESGLAEVAGGLDVSFPVAVETGGLRAQLGFEAIWSGTSGAGGTGAFDGSRGKVSFGLDREFGTGARLSVSGSYDGLGAGDFERFGIDVQFRHEF